MRTFVFAVAALAVSACSSQPTAPVRDSGYLVISGSKVPLPKHPVVGPVNALDCGACTDEFGRSGYIVFSGDKCTPC